jgi:hypothetical protein
MAILAVGQRRYLYDKQQVYLFSYDVKFDPTRSYEDSIKDDVRFHLVGPESPKIAGRVFHVLDERTVMGNDSVSGVVRSLEENIYVPREGEAAVTNGRMILRADDGDILSFSEGVLQLGPLGCRSLQSPDPTLPAEAKAMITCRFETANQKYKWLTEQLCVGFGKVTITDGMVREAKFDIYAIG